MTPAAVTGAVVDPVQVRLNLLSDQLAALAADLAAERLERDRWRDLVHELTPVAQSAMTLASNELEDLSNEVTIEDAVRLARTAARAMPQLEALLSQLGSAAELAHEATSLAGAGMGSLSDTLATAEQRGYFTAGRYAAATVDRLVATIADPAPATTPGIRELARRLRRPQVRRGLARAMDLLEAMGADSMSPRGSSSRGTPSPTRPPHPAKD